MSGAPAFASVVLDVDSTVSAIEGIDWLAARRGPDAEQRVAALTEEAMRGEIALERVYGERLERVRPSRDDLAALARAYEEALVPGCADAVRRLREAGVRVVLVSGGIREAIVPLAERLGVAAGDVHAVPVRHDAGGGYAGFDDDSPLTTAGGKREVVESLALPRPILAVGDGATDLAMRDAADRFAAFTGVVRRDPVIAGADVVIDSFDTLVSLVLP